MAQPKEAERAVPKWLAIALYPVGVLLLTLFFIYLGFPYDLLVARYARPLESATAMRVRIGAVEPHVSLLGPGIEVLDVQASRPGERLISVDRVFVRPAWSFSWLTGSPALYLDLASGIGAGSGTITLGSSGAWEGEVSDVQIEALPLKSLTAELDIVGTLDATIDLRARSEDSGGGVEGHVRFDLRSGSVGGPGIPIALPFETFGGDLRFGEEGSLVRIDNGLFEGPLLAATIMGEIGPSAASGGPSLDIDVDYEIHDETLASMLGSFGGGESRIEIGGTLQRPVIR